MKINRQFISTAVLLTALFFLQSCKKNSSEPVDQYDYPTGALASNFADIPNLGKIEDIDTSNLPVFQRPGGVTPSGYIIDLMPDPELLQDPQKQTGGSCVAWAFCNVLNYQFRIIEGNNLYGAPDKIFSPYYLFTQRSENNNENSGISPKDVIQLLRNQGCPKWVDMPNPGAIPYNLPIEASARANAAYYKITGVNKLWRLVNPVQLLYIKSLLRRNYPLAFAAKIDYGFMNPRSKGYRMASDGRFVWKSYCRECTPSSKNPDKDLFHEMVLCGYDNDINAFKVLNSWGPAWGNNGYIWIDYDFFMNAVLKAPDESPEIYQIEPRRAEGTLTTNQAATITSTSATCTGTVTINSGTSVLEKGICYSENINPTTGSKLTTNISVNGGTGNGPVTANLTGLKPDTRYWVRTYAKTDKGIIYGNEISFRTTAGSANTVTDIDGNVYSTVQIGTQTWMVQNLKTTRFRDGSPIPLITNQTQWTNLSSGAWCYYDNDSANGIIYGKLYNWFAVTDPRGLAPSGWHIPSDAEWTILTNYLGGQSVAGGKMKAVTNLWLAPNTGATNSSGFTGLPGGSRTYMGNFNRIGTNGYWWTTTQYNSNANQAWGPDLSHSTNGANKGAYNKTEGFAIRCIKD